MTDRESGADLVERLRAASDAGLQEMLAAADVADIAMHRSSGPLSGSSPRIAAGTTEIVLLGGLGCRYGMLADGAGGASRAPRPRAACPPPK